MLHVQEVADQALNLLDLDIEPFAHRVGDRILAVGQDVIDMLHHFAIQVADQRYVALPLGAAFSSTLARRSPTPACVIDHARLPATSTPTPRSS